MYGRCRGRSAALLLVLVVAAGLIASGTAMAQVPACPQSGGSPCVTLQKCAPACVNLNCDFQYTITLTNRGGVAAANVMVTDKLPAGVQYLGSQPQAAVGGNVLTWSLGSLAGGACRTLTVKVKAVQKVKLVNCATVTYSATACATTCVMEPKLVITKRGTKKVCLGKAVGFKITVKNVGDGTATNVVLTDTLPPGLTPKGADSVLKFPIGTLAPGQERSFAVNSCAVARGTHTNTAVVTADCGLRAQATASVWVYQPILKICKTGPAVAYIRCPITYSISVANSGDGPAPVTVVTDFLPQNMALVSASKGGQFDAATNSVTWNLGDLGAGKGATMHLKVKPACIQTYCNKARVTTCCGVTKWATLQTVVKGMAGVLLEAVDNHDALCIGENVTYTIRVTNQGSAVLHNIKIAAQTSEHMVPQSAGGATAGAISARSISFPTVAELPVGASVTYTIVAKGVKAGDARLRVSLTGSELTKPVTEEESTTFYNQD